LFDGQIIYNIATTSHCCCSKSRQTLL